ncbi:S9 family peptidase [Chryseobacterium sp. MDT2-18]|uniref:alpha/beta hydrolase family protein n=1 Tax=Chryseobacterium sp. MDT2-18 TaxID=1259136 RepID=UPI002785AD32|nr:alpha/beta fold hydrolase [Chryseobacterium sp. MDT2-18]MDQ0476892.1 dipeptidyl aminopeptidase/acylaminoacyl peptidase [Chryseobacterium sp. MDT2-18]
MKLNIEKNIIIKNAETHDFLADAYYPEDAEKLPLVIFAHGYKGYKDWGAWDLMAKKLAEAGFFFVKFNFSHNGTTIAQPKDFADLEAFGHNNFSKEMSDFDEVLNHFYNHLKIDNEKICIIGHSRGGGITVIKTFEDERIKILITLAGVSNFKYRFPTKERFEDWKREGVMYSENKRTHQEMPHYFQFFEDFEKNERRFDIQYAAQHLEKPFLIIQGTDDEAVKDKEAFLLNEWCKTSELVLLENANHTFGAKEPWTENKLPEDLEKASSKMIQFMRSHFETLM